MMPVTLSYAERMKRSWNGTDGLIPRWFNLALFDLGTE